MPVSMNAEAIKRTYGEEYPAAVVINGVRVPLSIETRFTRVYNSHDSHIGGCVVSRFMDGSASITAVEFQREWPTWKKDERVDFCQSSSWLHQQRDFLDILRFIMAHGGPQEWPAIAVKIATYLPCEEAYPFLVDALQATNVERCSNIVQAIAITKHPEADKTLRKHLRVIWGHPKLWNDDNWLNWVADTATTCIQHLIEIGAPPADFEDQVRRLSEHVCERNRETCQRKLSNHYPWLKD